MSDQTTTIETPVASALPPISYTVVPFRKGGAAEQFSFTTKEYNNIDAAISDLGVNSVLDVINAEVAARIGMKARAQAGFGDLGSASAANYGATKNALEATLIAKYPTKVIFSEADAQAWKPGERELTIGGIQKKINEAFKVLMSAKTAEEKATATVSFNNWIAQLTTAAQRGAERAEVV